MNFPFVSLDSYISLDDRKSGIKAFMGDLKKWLQSQKLTFAWLAENMQKSEGTVKNWFYSGLNIDDEKLERILALCKAHLDGGEGVAYPQEADARAMSYIHLKPYTRDLGVENDLAGEPSRSVSQWANHGAWCLAAGVPEDTIAEMKYDYFPVLARWVTDVLMGVTRAVLSEAKKRGKLDLNRETDGRVIPQNAPCPFRPKGKHSWERRGKDDVFGADEVELFLPVIRQKWRSDYLRLAAGLSGFAWSDLWVLYVLNEAACKQKENDLDAFLADE